MEKVTSEGYVICMGKPDYKQLVDFNLQEEYLFNEMKDEIKVGNERVVLKYFKLFPNSNFLSYYEIVREKDFDMYFRIIRRNDK